jgi:2-polyprenyl-6-methoxyphenol hydroxylase-like FAD-dependent oxidoreductase
MKVLIAGGGIAGTACAIALRQAGIAADIYEAFGHDSEGIGAFLTLGVNGLDALRIVGVDVSTLGGFATPHMTLSLGNGRRLAEFSVGPRDRADGLVARTIARGALYARLRDEAVRRGAGIHYRKRLSGVDESADGIGAIFTDGSRAVGDVLVGADGLHSRVRVLVDANAPRARYVGLLNTGGCAQDVRVPGAVGAMHMFFGRRCFFAYIPHPNGQVLWFANPARAREPTRAELARLTPQVLRRELNRLFAGDNTPARALIGATREILPAWGTYDFPHVPHWHRDRMVIIGDAAHAASPSSGQGASMAIEDAVVLARCLRDAASVKQAFATYEGLRRERVEKVVAMGKRNGTGKTPGPLGRWVRDLVLQMVFSRQRGANPDPMAWLFDHRIAWERQA